MKSQVQREGNRECIAQGSANILNGFFLWYGRLSMIAQTLVNLSAGSRARLSGIVAAYHIDHNSIWSTSNRKITNRSSSRCDGNGSYWYI
jgi:hypothetical protein